MSFLKDVLFCLKPRCPVCQRGRLFKPGTISAVDQCAECAAPLGQHDVGDGAAVFLIFFLGFTVIPAAWGMELLLSPPLWVHGVVWGAVVLGVILLLLPAIKAYIILLEYRHRRDQPED